MKGMTMTETATPDPSLEPQPVEVDTDDTSTPEEHDHAEIYDDEADSLDEPDFDAPEQNEKEATI
jgi:hypothetical protein